MSTILKEHQNAHKKKKKQKNEKPKKIFLKNGCEIQKKNNNWNINERKINDMVSIIYFSFVSISI